MGARASVLSGGELDKWEKIRLRPGGKEKISIKTYSMGKQGARTIRS
nr:gag polyprotein [Human immunodeficiency virus 1]